MESSARRCGAAVLLLAVCSFGSASCDGHEALRVASESQLSDEPVAASSAAASRGAETVGRGTCPAVPAAPTGSPSEADFAAFRDAIKKALACDIQANVNTEVYLADLSYAQAQLKSLREREQKEVGRIRAAYDTEQKQTIDDFKAGLQRFVSAEQQVLAETKYTLAEIDKILAHHGTELAQTKADHVAFAVRYKEYHATESAAVRRLENIIAAGSQADVPQLLELRVQVAELARQESLQASDVAIEARRLAAQIAALVEVLNVKFAKYRDFLNEHNMPGPDGINEAVVALRNMAAYADQRSQRMSQATTRVADQLSRRRDLLIAAQAEASTRETLRQAAFMQASARYLKDTTARVQQLWRLPAKSTVLKLPFYSAAHAEYVSFLQLETPCNSSGRPDWMEVGCRLMQGEFAKIRTVLNRTLPFTLRAYAGMLRRAGVDEALVKSIEANLAAGDLDGAVLNYDIALRASDRGRNS